MFQCCCRCLFYLQCSGFFHRQSNCGNSHFFGQPTFQVMIPYMSLPWEIPFYGDHVSLFTLLMTVSTVMYTYMNNQMMGSQTTQMPGMKTMMYIMPIMFLGIFNNYASGLSYYYFLANIITFGQMFVFRYAINEDKLRAQDRS